MAVFLKTRAWKRAVDEVEQKKRGEGGKWKSAEVARDQMSDDHSHHDFFSFNFGHVELFLRMMEILFRLSIDETRHFFSSKWKVRRLCGFCIFLCVAKRERVEKTEKKVEGMQQNVQRLRNKRNILENVLGKWESGSLKREGNELLLCPRGISPFVLTKCNRFTGGVPRFQARPSYWNTQTGG